MLDRNDSRSTSPIYRIAERFFTQNFKEDGGMDPWIYRFIILRFIDIEFRHRTFVPLSREEDRSQHLSRIENGGVRCETNV